MHGKSILRRRQKVPENSIVLCLCEQDGKGRSPAPGTETESYRELAENLAFSGRKAEIPPSGGEFSGGTATLWGREEQAQGFSVIVSGAEG